MSDKKSESNLPNGGYILTDGSNYGLDGFQFDTEYGGGVLEKARLPEAHGLSSLPEGIFREENQIGLSDLPVGIEQEEGVGDLGSYLKEASATLSDLNWLEGVQQDPERLPINNPHEIIKELEEAWGVHNRTNGKELVPNKVVRPYERDVYPESKLPGYDERRAYAQLAMEKALREQLLGHSEEKIIAKLEKVLSGGELAEARRTLLEDKGLVGNVYLRAKAFPGLHRTSKWDSLIPKLKRAQYILTDDPKLLEVGRAYGKKIVASIPWGEAFKAYAPRLNIKLNRKLASSNKREALREAFLAQENIHVRESHLPVQADPSNSISLKTAKSNLRVAEVHQEVFRKLSAEEQLRTKVDAQISKWASQGLLDERAQKRLAKGNADAKETLRVAASLVQLKVAKSARFRKYAGEGVNYQPLSIKEASQAWRALEQFEAQAEDKMLRQAKEFVDELVDTGMIKGPQGRKILASDLNGKDRLRVASAVLAKNMAKADQRATKVKVANYNGLGNEVTEHVSKIKTHTESDLASLEDQRIKLAQLQALDGDNRALIAKQASEYLERARKNGLVNKSQYKKLASLNVTPERKVSLITAVIEHSTRTKVASSALASEKKAYSEGVAFTAHVSEKVEKVASQKELSAVNNWVSRQMNEGAIGNELDQLIHAKFSDQMIKQASEHINSLRKAHEGLAGVVYVDAKAYASKDGTTGCDEGALRHRANPIKFLLKMDKCKGCVFANADGVCQKYNKTLVKDVPVEDREGYQRESIRLANAPDHEITASLFGNSYDPNEFNLANSDFDSIGYNSEKKAQDKLSEVLFGGFEID